jgi:transglutaminase-like putative cysteine protease
MKRRSVLRGGALLFLLLAGGVLFFVWKLYPTLSVVDPVTPFPGDTVSIVGRNLGEAPGELLFDGIALPARAIQSWGPTYITFKMPNDVDSAVVRVRTAFGTSNPLMLASSLAVPKPQASQAAADVRPNITGVKPTANLQIGKPVVVNGSHFGEPEERAAIFFTKVPSISALETENSENFIRVESASLLVDRWGDTSITLHVPDGVENGYLFVKTKNGESNTYPVFFSRSLGKTLRGNASRYVMEHRVVLYVVASLPEGSLALFLPKPVATQYQHAETTIERGEEHLSADREGWQEYRFDHQDARKGKLEIVRHFLVDTSEVRADINVNAIQGVGSEPPAFLVPYLKPDALVPSEDEMIVSQARAIQKKEKNPFRQVALAAQWVFSNVALDKTAQDRPVDVHSALNNKAGSMQDLVLIDCALLRAMGIPAAPVSGFLVTDDMRLIPHYWGEYYLVGIGWIPFDPALATGNVPSGFVPAFSERLTYYRGIDSRHIAMGRGYRLLPPVQPGVQKKARIPWSFSEYDEVSQGLSYTAIWEQPALLPSASQ